LLVTAAACASKQPPKPVTPRPDAAEKLVSQLTEWLKLDASQQEKTRQFARELIARNEKIHENWDKTKKPHPEELLGSRAVFQNELFTILTPEQKKRFTDTAMRIQAQGRMGPKSPS
jgi:Spy/CpxP family protein refolding chaperone